MSMKKIVEDIFNAPRSDRYNAWLDKLTAEGYGRTYASVYELDPRLNHFEKVENLYFSAEEGGWHTTGDRWSKAEIDGETIYRRDYGNAVDFWASEATIKKWYLIWWEKLIAKSGKAKAALHVLTYHEQGTIGSDMPAGIVEMFGLDQIIQFARQETEIFWNCDWLVTEQRFSSPEKWTAEACAQYGIPTEFVWKSPIETGWNYYQQRNDGSWWIKTKISEKSFEFEYRKVEPLPLNIQRSGGYYAPPVDADYAKKQQYLADFYNVPRWDVVWIEPKSLREGQFSKSRPEAAMEVVKESVARGEGNVWQIIIRHDKNNKLYDSWGSTYSRMVYVDFYFSSEPTPLDLLGYNSEIGLHPVKE